MIFFPEPEYDVLSQIFPHQRRVKTAVRLARDNLLDTRYAELAGFVERSFLGIPEEKRENPTTPVSN